MFAKVINTLLIGTIFLTNFSLVAVCQNIPKFPDSLLDIYYIEDYNAGVYRKVDNLKDSLNNIHEFLLAPNEAQIGNTFYDMQTISTISNRISIWNDGTISVVWTFGLQPTSFPDRGTGYNYYDGSNWDAMPQTRLENRRCGWTNIAPWGSNGEVTCSHNYVEGLEFMWNTSKGSGNWVQQNFLGPSGIENDIAWPRMVSSGTDNEFIHLVTTTKVEFNGQTKALLYSRSSDGGTTWNPKNIVLEGTGPVNYKEIPSDSYSWTSSGNTVALLVCSAWNDLFILKSIDNGNTWNKTVIWKHPYPLFDWNSTITGQFYCVDNSANLAIDQDGIVHVVFGINKVMHDSPGYSYNLFPYVDGIGYWNENMPTFSNHINALAPPQYQEPGSEMIINVNYIGWMQDVNGNGELDLNTDIMFYRSFGPSTMPTITIDEFGNRFIIFSSTTETYEVDVYNYKHIWARAFCNDQWGNFLDLTSNVAHTYDECIYPVLANSVDNNIHYIYNTDVTPGTALDENHGYQDNKIIYGNVSKMDLGCYGVSYSVETSSNPPEGGETSGGGVYFANEQVTVIANENNGFTFLNWTENSQIVSFSNIYTFTINEDRSLVANFSCETAFSLTLTVNPIQGGTTIGSGNYTAGSNVSIKARPYDGWEFVNWTENSTVISSDTVYTFQINSDRVIEANFNQLSYDLSLNSVPPDGGNTVGEGTYYYDDQVEISAYPNEHWSFVNWKEADTVLSDLQSLTITIRADRTINGIFQEDQKFDVSVTAQPQEGGMVLGDSSYYYGDYATVMANANQGWQFIEWQVGGTFVSSSQEYSFMVSESVNMVAVFESTGVLSLLIENTGNDTICQGENILLQCLPSGGSPPYDFNWTSDPPGITGTSSEISDMPGVNTIYIVSVTDALLNFRSDSIEIRVKPSPPANVVGKGTPPYMIICVDSGYSYQWFFNDAILDGETKQFYYPGAQGLELGQYYVNVTNDEGCSAKSNIFERSAKSAFDIWPNPSTGEFYVSVSSDLIAANEEAQIRIVDLNGKILEEIIISSEMANKIIRHNFFVGKKGVFIAEFIGSNQRMAKKVIVY